MKQSIQFLSQLVLLESFFFSFSPSPHSSSGHRIDLETATALTTLVTKFKVPEPVRQADLRSREFLRKNYVV